METSKVILGNETLIDLTNDDVTQQDVLQDVHFHLPNGVRTVGRLNPVLKPDVAPVEQYSTAGAAHASGTYLYYNNALYKATADIAVDDPIVTSGASANVEAVTVGGELVTLNTSLAQKTPKSDIAIIESGTTASANRAVGDFVYVSGTLYRVTAAISAGAAYTVGTNIVTDTVGGELAGINANIQNLSSKLIGIKTKVIDTAGSPEDVSFTFSTRGAALVLIHQNASQSTVAAIAMSATKEMIVNILAGYSVLFTNDGWTVKFHLTNWSNATIISNVAIS